MEPGTHTWNLEPKPGTWNPEPIPGTWRGAGYGTGGGVWGGLGVPGVWGGVGYQGYGAGGRGTGWGTGGYRAGQGGPNLPQPTLLVTYLGSILMFPVCCLSSN